MKPGDIELNSLPPEETQPQRSQMAMNSDKTVRQYKAREIEQPEPDTKEVMARTEEQLNAVQNQYRALTVSGRKRQRDRLRKKLGLSGTPARGVRDAPMPRAVRSDDLVEDKIYAVGKPRGNETE